MQNQIIQESFHRIYVVNWTLITYNSIQMFFEQNYKELLMVC